MTQQEGLAGRLAATFLHSKLTPLIIADIARDTGHYPTALGVIGLAIGGGAGNGWALAPWGDALLWAALVLFLGFALRGRGFGPRLPAEARGERPSSEYVAAVGRLLRRSPAPKLRGCLR